MHIAIAGNIGSGKTTLAGLLAKHLEYQVEYENPTENPYIVDFYRDMQRWAFNMQVHFLDVRIRKTIQLQKQGAPVVQDRTIYEDAEVFAPILLKMGLIKQRDYTTYRNLYETLIGLIDPPDLVIYLQADFSTLANQIAQRNREYEDSIRLDYLKSLNAAYDAWYEGYNRSKKMVVSADDNNFHEDPEDLGKILNSIKAEFSGLFPDPG